MENNKNEFPIDLNKDMNIKIFNNYYGELKYRLQRISDLCEVCFVTNKTIDNILFESICLQLRKILEIIAMSSLISNKKVFNTVKTEIFKEWNAKNIIKEIEKYSKNVFPIESYEYCEFDTSNIFEFTNKAIKTSKPILSKDLFCEIYDRCGGILHIANPFGNKPSMSKKINYICSNIGPWIDCIYNTYLFCSIAPYDNGGREYKLYMGNLKGMDNKVYLYQTVTI